MLADTRSYSDPLNALTVDVEDYYQVEGFSSCIRREEWLDLQSRVERSCVLLLDLFERHKVQATFFSLGWVAQQYPSMIREIAAAGHEVACHGFDHRLVYRQSRSEFKADVYRAKCTLEDILGHAVAGYRAPCYSITSASIWALDVLIESGFRYDSSIFPVRHDRYGIPGAQRFPHVIERPAGEILELPPSTLGLGHLNLPMAGGGYFRLYPYALFRTGLRVINRIERQAAIFVIHPWEVDPGQPIIRATWLNRWRHRVNLHRTLPRLERLLSDFRFGPIRDLSVPALSGRAA